MARLGWYAADAGVRRTASRAAMPATASPCASAPLLLAALDGEAVGPVRTDGSRQVAKTDRPASLAGGATRAGRGPADEHRADARRPASARAGPGTEPGSGRRRTEDGVASPASCRSVTELASCSARCRAVSRGGGVGGCGASAVVLCAGLRAATVHRRAQPRPRAQAHFRPPATDPTRLALNRAGENEPEQVAGASVRIGAMTGTDSRQTSRRACRPGRTGGEEEDSHGKHLHAALRSGVRNAGCAGAESSRLPKSTMRSLRRPRTWG